MYVVSLFSRTLDVHHPQPLVGSSDYVTQFVHQHTHVGTAAFCFRSSPVHPERAVPHTGTSTSSTNAVALLTAAHRPCIRVRCLKLLLLQLPCVVCTCNTQKYIRICMYVCMTRQEHVWMRGGNFTFRRDRHVRHFRTMGNTEKLCSNCRGRTPRHLQ